jgi:hypothetical protein
MYYATEELCSTRAAPLGWLFLLLPAMVAFGGVCSNTSTTTISDTVYRADGTPAGGTLLISWPEFTNAAPGQSPRAIPASRLGQQARFGRLGPNANATAANTTYSVVYQLDDPL